MAIAKATSMRLQSQRRPSQCRVVDVETAAVAEGRALSSGLPEKRLNIYLAEISGRQDGMMQGQYGPLDSNFSRMTSI
jgi:hypothetical protein